MGEDKDSKFYYGGCLLVHFGDGKPANRNSWRPDSKTCADLEEKTAALVVKSTTVLPKVEDNAKPEDVVDDETEVDSTTEDDKLEDPNVDNNPKLKDVVDDETEVDS